MFPKYFICIHINIMDTKSGNFNLFDCLKIIEM